MNDVTAKRQARSWYIPAVGACVGAALVVECVVSVCVVFECVVGVRVVGAVVVAVVVFLVVAVAPVTAVGVRGAAELVPVPFLGWPAKNQITAFNSLLALSHKGAGKGWRQQNTHAHNDGPAGQYDVFWKSLKISFA